VANGRKILVRLLAVSGLVVPIVLAAATTAASASGVDLYVSPGPPDATVGQAYSYQLNVVGGTPPYTFTFSNVSVDPYAPGPPAGISISSSGLMTGVPVVAEQSEWEYFVSDSAGDFSGGRYLSMTVSTGNATLDPVLIPADTSLLVTGNQAAAIALSAVLEVVGIAGAVPDFVDCVVQNGSVKYCGL